MTVSLGQAIYVAVKPIFKIYLIIGVGFGLARYGILSVEATRIVSDIVLTILIPCLAFSKIVPYIEGQDIKQVGIICLSSVLVFGTGLFMAFLVRTFLPVPKRWRGGILAGGMFPNISDLPIAYLQSMDNGFIFTEEEGNKGVASVIIFMTMFMICVFNLGGFRLIESDFHYNDIENADQESTSSSHDDDEALSKKRVGDTSTIPVVSNNNSNYELKSRTKMSSNIENDVNITSSSSANTDDINSLHSQGTRSTEASIPSTFSYTTEAQDLGSAQPRHYSRELSRTDNSILSYRNSTNRRNTDGITRVRSLDLRDGPPQDMNDIIKEYSNVDQFGHIRENPYYKSPEPHADGQSEEPEYGLGRILTSDATVTTKDIRKSGNFLPEKLRKFSVVPLIVFFLKNCLRPASIAVFISLVVAFIPWVKALCVTTEHTPKIHHGPDGQPVLSFLIDFTSYVGSAAVPFGLMLLGATLGRLKLGKLYPGFWKSAVVLVILRQCVMPIFGVLWCDRLVKAGWLNWESDKMLLFVIAINWGLPSMTTIIYFTASYTPLDCKDPIQMECVSFFLMLQYPLLIVSLPFLVTYFLKVQIKV